jgi:aminoglycoside phosphotransferase (APT) family kinase protein
MREQLAAWLGEQAGSAVVVERLAAPARSGHSHETLLCDARIGGEAVALVVRLEPAADPIFPDYDLATERRVLAALAEVDGVPVPRVRWFEDDPAVLGRRFFVMDRVEGEVPAEDPPFLLSGFLHDAPAAEQAGAQAAVVEILAAIHRVDWQAAGLGPVLDRSRFGRPGLDQELGYWAAYLDWAAADGPLPRLAHVFDWCADHRPVPEPAPALCWGDARYGNIVFAGLRPAAVLDWEMALLGPPELDLGWFCFLHDTALMWMPDLAGFAGRDGVIDRYEAALGRPVEALRWYEVWAGLRAAAVQAQIVRRSWGSDPPADRTVREQTPVLASLRRLLPDL